MARGCEESTRGYERDRRKVGRSSSQEQEQSSQPRPPPPSPSRSSFTNPSFPPVRCIPPQMRAQPVHLGNFDENQIPSARSHTTSSLSMNLSPRPPNHLTCLRLMCPRQDCSSAWTTTTTMSTMSTTTAMTTRTTTRRTTTAAASCFLLVVGSKGESWCFSDGISGVVTSGADRSHSGLQICHPQPARPCA
ncbi:hypothetical protein ALC60_02191 [Trachymyrmex zeteki]|uniref:Uncharacterized protein n=1 Tax=Mycetomoellerius zeteki TaxID=64791 RepID=A0A151XDT8_9HYME|nr:hypothetical protein ALC60_02191 [Trachymyrmex zeteki]